VIERARASISTGAAAAAYTCRGGVADPAAVQAAAVRVGLARGLARARRPRARRSTFRLRQERDLRGA